jgi:hypothetical protein
MAVGAWAMTIAVPGTCSDHQITRWVYAALASPAGPAGCEKGRLGRAGNLRRRPDGRLRWFVKPEDVKCQASYPSRRVEIHTITRSS